MGSLILDSSISQGRSEGCTQRVRQSSTLPCLRGLLLFAGEGDLPRSDYFVGEELLHIANAQVPRLSGFLSGDRPRVIYRWVGPDRRGSMCGEDWGGLAEFRSLSQRDPLLVLNTTITLRTAVRDS